MKRRRSRLARTTQLRFIEHFVAGTPARTAAELVGVNRNTATLYYHKLRETIADHIVDESPFEAEIELDESYFGGVRKGKRGRGAAGKVVVFGILKRGGRVYTVVPPDLKRSTLLPIIRRRVRPDSIVYTDGLSVYDALDVAGFRHRRIDHGDAFADISGAHLNGIENFPPADGGSASQAKRHLRRYNGIPWQHFELFLKEGAWRFNYRSPREPIRTLIDWHLI